MKIYVASSWRNEYQPEVVRKLQELGHEVYDFRGAGDGWGADDGDGGFSWRSIDGDWQQWTPQQYVRALEHPFAVDGFNRDMNALKRCDACVFVMPCGPSASMELGWAVGAGKLTAAYIPGMREPDLMVKMADHIATRWESIELWLRVPLEV